ncbi:MAG: osmotically inducible protein OsmC [Candidatus Aminicenantes bacterium RBG_16_63_16]|nr:MAG: osmotically inducible protein OsmC [Candidatus Aminicenantes bacterium RBG_16_63_16]
MSEREIQVTFPGGVKVDAVYKGFLIKTDQPVHQGGEGTAPAPFDLFLASIATCAGFYTVAFCRERGIPTENAGVVMRAEKDPETKMISKIRIELRLPAGFPEKYMRAVIKAVDYCTVKAHILKPPAFEITAEIPK